MTDYRHRSSPSPRESCPKTSSRTGCGRIARPTDRAGRAAPPKNPFLQFTGYALSCPMKHQRLDPPARRSAAAASPHAIAARFVPAIRVPDFTPVPLRARADGWTPARQRGFIAALARCGSILAAARHVGIAPRNRLSPAPTPRRGIIRCRLGRDHGRGAPPQLPLRPQLRYAVAVRAPRSLHADHPQRGRGRGDAFARQRRAATPLRSRDARPSRRRRRAGALRCATEAPPMCAPAPADPIRAPKVTANGNRREREPVIFRHTPTCWQPRFGGTMARMTSPLRFALPLAALIALSACQPSGNRRQRERRRHPGAGRR